MDTDRNERRRRLMQHMRTSPPISIDTGYRVVLTEDVSGFMVDAFEAWWLIEQLRAVEGNSVEIIHDNPDFGGKNSCVILTTDFTVEHRFYEDTVIEALRNAYLEFMSRK